MAQTNLCYNVTLLLSMSMLLSAHASPACALHWRNARVMSSAASHGLCRGGAHRDARGQHHPREHAPD